MARSTVVVLGGSDAALGTAATLALGDRDVVLWEPASESAPGTVAETPRRVRVCGPEGDHEAVIARVTRDPFEALAAGDLILVVMAGAEQASIGDLLLPIAERRHVIGLLPGDLGSLVCAKWLRDRGRLVDESPTFVDVEAVPQVCRTVRADHIRVLGASPRPGVGVFPACRSGDALAALAPVFPGAHAFANVVAASLGSLGPLLRPAVALMNAGRFDGADGRAPRCDVTPGVVRVIEAVDAERRAVSGALGFELAPAAEALSRQATLGELLNAGDILSCGGAPVSLRDALSRDVPGGLRLWAELGASCGVQVPAMRALLHLAEIAKGSAGWSVEHSLEDLGIEGMSPDVLGRYLETGALD
jgi:opine dehydrogenase